MMSIHIKRKQQHFQNANKHHQQHQQHQPRWVLNVLTLIVIILPPFFWYRHHQSAGRLASNNATTSILDYVAKHQQLQPIRQISILGERNSGTRWTFDHISECFNHSIPVKKQLTRYKHWFQYQNTSKYPADTLVLAQFRNPYDWFKAMEHVPHHSPAHLRLSDKADVTWSSSGNDWKTFLTKPWTMPRVGSDLLLSNNANSPCQEDFSFRDIISCQEEPLPRSYYNWTLRYSENQPFYEMRNDGSGEPYPNILELRTDKIRNFLSVAEYPGVADVWIIQYEYLLKVGTQHLIDLIAEWTGITPACQGKPPQNRRQKKSRAIELEFAAHIRKHLNWTVEGWIGYGVELHREQEPSECLSVVPIYSLGFMTRFLRK